MATLGLSVICARAVVFDFSAPLTSIEVSTTGGRVTYRVFDSSRSAWQEGSDLVDTRVSNLSNVSGVVAWVDRDRVKYAVYDPARGIWQRNSDLFSTSVSYISNVSGVVAWMDRDRVNYVVYDPARATWQRSSDLFSTSVSYISNSSRVIAWVDRDRVNYAVYDPARGDWRRSSDLFSASVSFISNADGVVAWTAGGRQFFRGYNQSSGSWYGGPTLPLAYFSASTVSGNAPLHVQFGDMSLGSTGWIWDFGDGALSTVRGPSHRFTGFGKYTVTQNVSGPSGSNSRSITVITDVSPPTGSVQINSGATSTESSTVTLTLSATDNSGRVAMMRFSNDGSNWSNWEPFATTKSWTLSAAAAPGAGQRREVSVGFRDAVENVSSTFSDSILLSSSRITITASPSAGGTVGGGGTFNAGSTVTVTATPASGFNFVNWTENGKQISTSASYQFTASGNRNLIANFASLRSTLALSVSPLAGGSIEVNPSPDSDGKYAAGTQVTLTAKPSSGYRLSLWSGDASGSSNPITITMNGSRSVIANFGCSYSLSPPSRSHGSLAETQSLNVITGGDCAWTASANVSWITITQGASGNGSGAIAYSVAANPTANARTGAITVQGESFTVTQEGATRVLAVSGDLAFGSVIVGTSSNRTFTISNNGNSTLTVRNLTVPSGFKANWLGGPIPPGGSTNVTVTFLPAAAASYGGNITIDSDKTSGPEMLAVSGTGASGSSSYIPTPEQASFAVRSSAGRVLAKVTVELPDAGYRVTSWGRVVSQSGMLTADAEMERPPGMSVQVITVLSHDYDLGVLPSGDHQFAFKASGQTVKIAFFSVHTITASAGPVGTIEPAGTIIKLKAESQTFTASPSAGYAVDQWLLGGSVVQSGGTSYTLNNIEGNHSLSVRFKPVVPDESQAWVTRAIPRFYTPGVKLTVTLQTSPSPNTGSYAVEDEPPPGWAVTQISEGGLYDAGNKKVKFGLFFDANARTLTYELTPPVSATGAKQFRGTSSADGISVSIGGSNSLEAVPLHPADSSPADRRISIEELTAYGSAWRKGTAWPVGPNPIPIDYVTRAGALWQYGERYICDPLVAGPPLWWVNTMAAKPASLKSVISRTSRGSVVRTLSALFAEAEVLQVSLLATAPPGVSAYAVQDRAPKGWFVTRVSDGGELDLVNGQLKWGPFFEGTARRLNYELRFHREAQGVETFEGEASFDGMLVPIGGESRSEAACRIRGLRRLTGQRFELDLGRSLDRGYTIEVSSDLIEWEVIATSTSQNGMLEFTDASALFKWRRFYRVVREKLYLSR